MAENGRRKRKAGDKTLTSKHFAVYPQFSARSNLSVFTPIGGKYGEIPEINYIIFGRANIEGVCVFRGSFDKRGPSQRTSSAGKL